MRPRPSPGESDHDDEIECIQSTMPAWVSRSPQHRRSTAAEHGAADEAPGPQLFLRTMLRPGDWAEQQRAAQAERAEAAEAAAARTAEYRRWEVPLSAKGSRVPSALRARHHVQSSPCVSDGCCLCLQWRWSAVSTACRLRCRTKKGCDSTVKKQHCETRLLVTRQPSARVHLALAPPYLSQL